MGKRLPNPRAREGAPSRAFVQSRANARQFGIAEAEALSRSGRALQGAAQDLFAVDRARKAKTAEVDRAALARSVSDFGIDRGNDFFTGSREAEAAGRLGAFPEENLKRFDAAMDAFVEGIPEDQRPLFLVQAARMRATQHGNALSLKGASFDELVLAEEKTQQGKDNLTIARAKGRLLLAFTEKEKELKAFPVGILEGDFSDLSAAANQKLFDEATAELPEDLQERFQIEMTLVMNGFNREAIGTEAIQNVNAAQATVNQSFSTSIDQVRADPYAVSAAMKNLSETTAAAVQARAFNGDAKQAQLWLDAAEQKLERESIAVIMDQNPGVAFDLLESGELWTALPQEEYTRFKDEARARFLKLDEDAAVARQIDSSKRHPELFDRFLARDTGYVELTGLIESGEIDQEFGEFLRANLSKPESEKAEIPFNVRAQSFVSLTARINRISDRYTEDPQNVFIEEVIGFHTDVIQAWSKGLITEGQASSFLRENSSPLIDALSRKNGKADNYGKFKNPLRHGYNIIENFIAGDEEYVNDLAFKYNSFEEFREQFRQLDFEGLSNKEKRALVSETAEASIGVSLENASPIMGLFPSKDRPNVLIDRNLNRKAQLPGERGKGKKVPGVGFTRQIERDKHGNEAWVTRDENGQPVGEVERVN